MKIKEVLSPFGKSGNIYLFGAITQGLAPVALTPFLTRSISADQFGQISVLNSLGLIVSILLSFGVPIFISRSYILEKSLKKPIDKLVNVTTTTYLFMSIFVFILFKITNLMIFLNLSIGLLFAIYQIGLPILRARNQSTLFASYSIINTLLPSLFIILFFKYFSRLLDLFFYGAFLAAIVGIIFLNKKSQIKISNSFIYNAIKTGAPILPHMLGMIALVNIDKVLFGSIKDESTAGFLQVIMLVGLSPIFILSALNHAWLNQILEQLKKINTKSLNQINKTIVKLLIICSLIIIFLFYSNSIIIEFLNPNIIVDFNISSSVMLSAISSFMYVIYLANTHILTWSKHFWVLGISTPSAVLVQSLSIYFLVDRFNYLSAALGFGLALTVQILFLELFNFYQKNSQIINYKYKLFAIFTFWIIAILIVFQTNF